MKRRILLSEDAVSDESFLIVCVGILDEAGRHSGTSMSHDA